MKTGDSVRLGEKLSRHLSFADRAAFIRFAKEATVGHWAEVIHTMEAELCREGRSLNGGGPRPAVRP